MRKACMAIAVFSIIVCLPLQANAFSENDVLRAQTYGALLGRAVACGINIDNQAYVVLAWIDATFRETAPQIAEEFIAVAGTSAQEQTAGKYQENCDQVGHALEQVIWPGFTTR